MGKVSNLLLSAIGFVCVGGLDSHTPSTAVYGHNCLLNQLQDIQFLVVSLVDDSTTKIVSGGIRKIALT